MDTHSDNLSELERRLANCKPATDGLATDAMLFAAGRAAAQPGAARFIWPGLSACLAALALVLGLWLATERSERLSLVQQFRQPAPAPPPSPVPIDPSTADELAPNSVLAARRALEQGLDAWPPVLRVDSPGPSLPDSPILRVGRPDTLPDL
jgi:hypothetical protein